MFRDVEEAPDDHRARRDRRSGGGRRDRLLDPGRPRALERPDRGGAGTRPGREADRRGRAGSRDHPEATAATGEGRRVTGPA